MNDTPAIPSGPGAAALLAAAIGATSLGVVIVGSEAFPRFKAWLNWWPPAGPLTGKVVLAIFAWAVAWAALHAAWRRREVRFATVAVVASVLLALGFVLTFPPVYEAFTRK